MIRHYNLFLFFMNMFSLNGWHLKSFEENCQAKNVMYSALV